LSLSLTDWWKLNASAILLLIRSRGNADGVSIDQKSNLHEIETVNQFQLGKTWSAELTGFFPGKQFFVQTKSSASFSIGAGVQKTLLQGQGTIRVNVNDIFLYFGQAQSDYFVGSGICFHLKANRFTASRGFFLISFRQRGQRP
jgi:hypothetical protein